MLGECVLPLYRLEHLVDQREWEAARQELEWLLASSRLDPQQRCWAHRHGCRIYSYLHNYYAAVKHGEIALHYAAMVGDVESQTRILFDLGHAHLWLGNATDAVEKLELFVEQMHDHGFSHLGGKAWYNLALAYRISGRLADAIQAHARAVPALEQSGDARAAMLALIDTAWCHLLQGEHVQAAPLLDQVEGRLSSEPDEELDGHLGYCRALHLRQVGELQASQQLCRLIWATSRKPEIVAVACWIAGENALDLGNLEEACRLADLALECSKQCPFPSVIEYAYQLLHRTREALSDERLSF